MNERQTAGFESACVAAGARFSGGVFACAALAQYELTGDEIYCGLTSVETRRTPADFMTVGWFTGHVPVAVPITASSFNATVSAAQASFDSFKELANVPFRFALELAPWLRSAWTKPTSVAVLLRCQRSPSFCDLRLSIGRVEFQTVLQRGRGRFQHTCYAA